MNDAMGSDFNPWRDLRLGGAAKMANFAKRRPLIPHGIHQNCAHIRNEKS
jgi:hypothetical protein